MQTYLILQKGEKRYLLLRGVEALHLITLDRRLTEQMEDWLLSQSRTVEEMNKRQLSRSTIELKNLRGYGVTGLEAGDTLLIYTKEGKRRYRLAAQCSREKLESLFQGFTRFNPPKPIDWQALEAERDWRTPRQVPELWDKLRWLGGIVNGISFFSGLAVMVLDYAHPWLNWLCLACFAGAILLFCLYPAHFTIFEDKRAMGKRGVIGLYLPVLLGPTTLFAAVLGHCCVLALWKAWVLGAAAVAALTLLLWKRSLEFREPVRIIGFLLVGALLSPGPVMAADILLDAAPVQEVHGEVVGKDRSSGRGGAHYDLWVLLDGEEYSIPVNRSTYEQTEEGDRVEVTVHQGALGIPYARIGEA